VVAADDVSVVHEPVFFNQINGGFGRDGSYRIAAKGRNLHALEAGCYFSAGHGDTNGRAVRHAFGGDDDVGSDLPLLDAEPAFAGASPGALHFISDKKTAIVLHDLENNLEIFFGRRNEAAHSLNWFGNISRNLS